MKTEPTRGNWQFTSSAVEGRYDIYTNESEGMIAQNVRYEDAALIASAKEMLAALKNAQAAMENAGPVFFGNVLDEVRFAIKSGEHHK